MKKIEKLLLESNDALRSAYQVAKRDGKETNWPAFKNMLSGVLDRQHSLTNKLRAPSVSNKPALKILRTETGS